MSTVVDISVLRVDAGSLFMYHTCNFHGKMLYLPLCKVIHIMFSTKVLAYYCNFIVNFF